MKQKVFAIINSKKKEDKKALKKQTALDKAGKVISGNIRKYNKKIKGNIRKGKAKLIIFQKQPYIEENTRCVPITLSQESGDHV